MTAQVKKAISPITSRVTKARAFFATMERIKAIIKNIEDPWISVYDVRERKVGLV